MKRYIIMTLAVVLLTVEALAQKNVQRAFDSFIKSKNVQVEKSLSSQHDPFPSGKNGEHPLLAQRDIYTFTLKTSDRKLLDKILLQMEADRDNAPCYLVQSHRGGKGTSSEYLCCSVGSNNYDAVVIGRDIRANWMAACYSADNEAYRHLYAVEWTEPAEGAEIHGRLIYTYAERQVEGGKQVDWKNQTNKDVQTEEDFVLRFMILKDNYLYFLSEGDGELDRGKAIVGASAIYVMCRDKGHLVTNEGWSKTIAGEIRQLIVKTGDRSQDAKWFLQHAMIEMEMKR